MINDFTYFNPQPKKGKKLPKPKKPLPKRSKKNKPPTLKQRFKWSVISGLGCIVPYLLPDKRRECSRSITIHHCFTNAGGRQDHDKTICLCSSHHLSREFGIDGRGMSKKQWQERYASEKELLELTEKLLTKEDL